MINVEPTAETIDNMTRRLNDVATELTRISKKMRESSDLSYASEAISCISNLMNSLRLDLLVTRPIRELLKREILNEKNDCNPKI